MRPSTIAISFYRCRFEVIEITFILEDRMRVLSVTQGLEWDRKTILLREKGGLRHAVDERISIVSYVNATWKLRSSKSLSLQFDLTYLWRKTRMWLLFTVFLSGVVEFSVLVLLCYFYTSDKYTGEPMHRRSMKSAQKRTKSFLLLQRFKIIVLTCAHVSLIIIKSQTPRREL